MHHMWNWLDRTILFSFDRTGYWRHSKSFAHSLPPSGKGKVCWLSGATGGLGRPVATELFKEDWELILPCRDLTKAQEWGGKASIDHLSLSSPKEVTHYLPHKPVDVMIHNAGAMPNTLTRNELQEEEIFASQVIAPFYLTKKWIKEGYLKKGGRVVFVSSGGMYTQKLSLEDVDYHTRSYNKYIAYANAKRAQVLLAELFAKKYRDYHFAAMHPGWVKTPGVYHSMRWFYYLLYPLLRTPEEGADTIHYLATTPRWEEEGAFWFDRSPVSPYMSEKTKSSDADKEALWALCEARSAQWESLDK